MYEFGERSLRELSTCHVDLQKIFKLAITRSKIDFGISEGNRPIERQEMLFKQGKSKIDGRIRKGKHNYSPSLAADTYVYHGDLETRRKLAYNKEHLAHIAGVIDSCAQELFERGEITHLIRWGANWDGDGIIALDQSFDDYPHFELIQP